MKVKNTKKINKYQMSIITVLVVGSMLILGVWLWFEMKNNELDDQLRPGSHSETINGQ